MNYAYYNENDRFATEWLRQLEHANHIAPGRVDDRSIHDVRAEDIGDGQAHFFAGIGGWSYALRLAGVSDDVRIWTGSCPCQPFSVAGRKRGIADERHLWPVWAKLIDRCRPSIVFGEQVAGRAGLAWLDSVFADLEGMGYACAAADLCAAGVGAPHIRQRLYFVAVRQFDGLQGIVEDGTKAPAAIGGGIDRWADLVWLPCSDGKARPTQPGLFPLAHGVSARVGRLRGYGNAIVPQLAATFVKAVMKILCEYSL